MKKGGRSEMSVFQQSKEFRVAFELFKNGIELDCPDLKRIEGGIQDLLGDHDKFYDALNTLHRKLNKLEQRITSPQGNPRKTEVEAEVRECLNCGMLWDELDGDKVPFKCPQCGAKTTIPTVERPR